jgi:hypothetical protein
MALGVKRIVSRILYFFVAAEQNASAMVMPMTEFMSDRKASPFGGLLRCPRLLHI